MSFVTRGLMVVAAAVTLAATSSMPLTAVDGSTARKRPVGAPSTPAQPSTSAFTPAQMEYYLGEDGVAYIRPGLKIKINSVTIGADRRAVVDFNVTDDFDQPLDRAGKITPGVVSTSWIFAYYDASTREYTAYTTRTATGVATSPNPGATAIQASSDTGGTYVELEMGHYTYKFGKVLPENYDKTKTHTIGIYATRNLTEILGKNYYANVEHDFRPDGGTIAATDKWDKIRDGACLNCHDPLALHGGSRRDVKLCVLCHSTQTTDPDTGNSVNMAEMIHKIHYPAGQTTPYIIWGNQSSIHNYSHVTYPQSVLNCASCHEGRTAAQKPTQSELWYTAPSRRACGACHTATDFANGSNHPKQTSDTQCSTCHIPESGVEFDNSVKGAHTVPLKSKQLKGLNVSIVSVTGVAAGSKPTVTFKITLDDGTAVDGNKLSTFAPILAGPTTSYVDYFRENAIGKGVYDAAAGTTTYTFTNMIPATGKGTWVISGDFYNNATLVRGDGGANISVRDAAVNPIKYVSTTSAAVVPRRQIVDIALCNDCHDRLALHGDQRLAIDECVICHNPVEDDQSRRPAAAGLPESVSFQRMIHRIHTGEELTQDYTVYGFGGTPHTYNEVLYPGDRRNCLSCHRSGTQQLPVALGADPVITLRDYFSPQGPGTASCLGCHDNEDAAAHAYLNTTTFPGSTKPSEACATCHGSGKEWSVDKSHAR